VSEIPLEEAVVYSYFDPPPKVYCDCSESPSLTKQSMKDECDINLMMARYQATGVMPSGMLPGQREAAFGDFSEGFDYMEAQSRILKAQEAFQSLPSRVRERFGDPSEIIEFLADPGNLEEAIKLGLVEKPAGAAPAEPAVSAGEGAPAAGGTIIT